MNTENSFLGTDTEPVIPPNSDEKTLGLLAHIITLISTFIGPLIIFLVKKDESAFVTHHAKESLNFQITMALLSIILFISIIGILLLWIVGILTLVLVIVATIRASEGKLYRYPFSIRFIK
ncbi:DUF4870 domain-containing protein [Arachidicoccus soli]|uniref:DUF4870 domain-containing protein n=1 Tax=Arachidicoccus soli TaxID=2341117 RepID=A0A386HM93_9BACT|nr:DUF4870 domain-containing protein [Arachidicoccus soli]AYD46863.1 DUF4870 domain-containing protein [Arachidicoccus soli]